MPKRRGNGVRIIGGAWRGRRIHFPAAPGLRPTSDRRRETLFNWLSGDLEGARCLDLFAGSGALGFEAASRGAAEVVLVEASREVAAALAANGRGLAAEHLRVVHARAARYLTRDPEPFDLVFIDPPFQQPELAADTLERLTGGWLAPGARVYLEVAAHGLRPAIPSGWRVAREATGGDAHALLFDAEGEASLR
ncbi:MAG: 16S rRNA (guanine(966)-N(2))-methyltransferase RsmD [Halofilum sp. (in: g-proteobacteria)]